MIKKFLFIFLFTLLVVAAFWTVLRASYMLNFDDNTHVMYNSMVRDTNWRAPLDIFITPDTANKTYVPLTVLTFFYENMFFGLHPAISHAINLGLHLAICCLVFIFARALGLSGFVAYAGALLFALHPMHVEPVAWVTARKDLLYSFFFLASLISYLRYIASNKAKDYIFALVSAALCVLAKPMGLSLPFVLLLLDWYKSRPFTWKLMFEKVPFFMVIQPIALITYFMNARVASFSWVSSPLLWLWCAAFYIQKFIYPVNLSVIYSPAVPLNWYNPEYLLAISLCLIALLMVWHFRRNKLVVFTAAMYFFCLFYVWRFDFFDLTFVADRFMYLPSLGFCLLFGVAAERLWFSRGYLLTRCLFIGLMLVLMFMTYSKAAEWKNSFTLWRNTLKQNQSAFVLNAYGEALLEENCFKDNKADFIKYLSASVGTSADKFTSHYADSLNTKVDAARRVVGFKSFNRLLKHDPNNLDALDNIGFLYLISGKYEKSLLYFERAIVLSKGLVGDYFFQTGVAYEYLGHQDVALANYDRVLFLGGLSESQARLNRANIFMKRGLLDEALSETLKVIQAVPGYDRAYDLAIIIAKAKADVSLEANIKRLQGYYKKRISNN